MMIIAIAATVCGCVANRPSPKGIDSLTDEDIGEMVVLSMEKIYRGVNSGRIARKSPSVRIVAKIKPFEVLNLQNEARAKEIASQLEMRLRKEMFDGGMFFFPDAPGVPASGAALQPDCILTGKLSCKIIESGGFSTSEFKLKLSTVDARTGIVAWEGNVLIAKVSE